MPQALTGQQKKGLAKATAAGTQDAYLQQHQGVAQHQQKVAAQGAPAAGAGGQKAAGQAAPSSQQTTKIRDLTGQQTKGLAKAEGAGRMEQYLQNHPGVAKHQQKVAAAGAPAGTPAGAPATGASGGKEGAANAATAPPAPGTGPAGGTAGGSPAPGAPAAPATTNDIINNQYGAGASDKFQQQWYGDNPLDTAKKAAERATGEALAGVRNRYGQSGFGMSGREALAEGQAVADVNTAMGQHLADLGTQVRGGDLDRLANMFATSGAQNLQERLGLGQLDLEKNQQLLNAGTGLTAIGAQEQQIPNMDAIMNMITNMSQQPTSSSGSSKQPRK